MACSGGAVSGAGPLPRPVRDVDPGGAAGASSSALSAATAPSASSAPPVAGPRRADRKPFPSTADGFECGTGSCRTHAEVCCSGEDEAAVCVLRSAVAEGADGGPLGKLTPLMQACAVARGESPITVVPLSLCDESADCEAGLCCSQAISGDSIANLCVQAPRGQKTGPCDIHEVCAFGGQCATKGMSCVDGVCRRSSPRLSCGKAVCTGAGEVCCGNPPRCAASSQCHEGQELRLECRSRSDCAPNESCVVGVANATSCTGMLGGGGALACLGTAECVGADPRVCPGKWGCHPSDIPGVKSCSCQ